jgi:predicted nucleic acid-binding protein
LANVFIDTQVIIHKNFNFDHELFQRLIHASNNGLITIYLTNVVKNEIESKIHDLVYEKVRNIHKKFATEAKILKNVSDYRNIFTIGEKLDEVYEVLINQFEQFLVDAKVEVISVNDVSPNVIFDMYFKGIAPFSVKKKDEFPDAFSLIALEQLSKHLKEKISIVSDDEDLESFCKESENLIREPSLESFFNNLSKNKKYMHQFIVSVYDENVSEIITSIQNQLEDTWFILMDEDGDVEKFEVQSIELDEDPYILEIEAREGVATLVFIASVSYIADVSYVDFSSSLYDKEEGKYLHKIYIKREIDDVMDVTVLMKIKYNHHNKKEIQIVSLKLNDGESLELYLPNEYY